MKKEEIIIKPKHVFAGNRNRMKKELRIFSKAETMDQLNKLDLVLVRMSRIFKWIFREYNSKSMLLNSHD